MDSLHTAAVTVRFYDTHLTCACSIRTHIIYLNSKKLMKTTNRAHLKWTSGCGLCVLMCIIPPTTRTVYMNIIYICAHTLHSCSRVKCFSPKQPYIVHLGVAHLLQPICRLNSVNANCQQSRTQHAWAQILDEATLQVWEWPWISHERRWIFFNAHSSGWRSHFRPMSKIAPTQRIQFRDFKCMWNTIKYMCDTIN